MDFIKHIQPVKEQEIQAHINQIKAASLNTEERNPILRKLISLIDLTTLNGDDTTKKVTALCDKAIKTENTQRNIPKVAAVCVYPNFSSLVSQQLKNTGIKTAVVATGFPSGQTFKSIKLAEVREAVSAGAEEIDMVISRGLFLEQKYEAVFEEIRQVKEACGEAHLKVILETGELKDLNFVKTASVIAIDAGADFIKTSTGKIKPAATPEAFWVMTEAIKEYFAKTGKKIGIKPAGGISDAETALVFYQIVAENLGDMWLNNNLFRIGASSLLDNLLQEI